jgi:hypothetical protein
MLPLVEVVDAYFAMWNETEPIRRAEAIARAWVEECRYVDPLSDVRGYASLAAMVEGAQAQFPRCLFRLRSEIEQHHDQARFTWDLVGPDGVVKMVGVDTCEVAPDGRLRRVVGFWGVEAKAKGGA